MTKEVRFRLAGGKVHGLWFDQFETLYQAGYSGILFLEATHEDGKDL